MKLMKILNINNNHLFQDNDIPFYVICKQFVNFYKIFLQGQKQNSPNEKEKRNSILVESFNELDYPNAILLGETTDTKYGVFFIITNNTELKSKIRPYISYNICLNYAKLEDYKNIFPRKLLMDQLTRIRTNKKL